MDLTCLHCDKQIHIEDSRVPEGVFKVRCPGCGKLITAERDAESPEPPKQSPAALPAPASQDFVKREIAALRQEILELLRNTSTHPAQSFQPDAENNTLEGRTSLPAWPGESVGNVALVCESDPATSMAISNTLKKLGYAVEVAVTAAECLKKLEAKSYRIVTVDSAFPDDKDGGNKIIGRINAMKPAARRLTFLANISTNTRTLDSGTAFFQGANIAVNKADLPKLESLIRDGFQQFQHFYHVFNRLLNEKDRQV